MAKVLQQRLQLTNPEEAQAAGNLVNLVQDAMDQTRRLAKGLHPVDLDAGSVCSALAELALRTQRLFSIKCTFKSRKNLTMPDASSAVHLYRIVQEAITNAIKHGRAANVQISLTSSSRKCVITINSDGADFPEDSNNSHGMGLRIMSHRAEMIGGLLNIRRGPEGGTIVTCVFPVTT